MRRPGEPELDDNAWRVWGSAHVRVWGLRFVDWDQGLGVRFVDWSQGLGVTGVPRS